MYIKKYLTGYGLVSVGIPLCIYCAAIFGDDKIRNISLVSLIFIAVIVVSFSGRLLNTLLYDRENNIADMEFVVKINCSLVIIFCLRYVFASIILMIPIQSDLLLHVFMSPMWLFIFIPFLKNYCLNKKTIIVTLMVSVVLIYVVFPIVISFLNNIINNSYFVVEGVYYNYFGFNVLTNRIVASISSLIGISIPSGILFPLLQITNIVVWCIMYLPYIIMIALIVDERSYMDMGKFVNTAFVLLLMIVFVVGIVGVSMLCGEGILDVDYVIFHNL